LILEIEEIKLVSGRRKSVKRKKNLENKLHLMVRRDEKESSLCINCWSFNAKTSDSHRNGSSLGINSLGKAFGILELE
jgi:hypothetical protein